MREETFERLYATHASGLFSYLVYRTGDRELSEDLLSETFIRVLRSSWRFDRRKASEKTWLYTIALNLLKDERRRAAAEARALQREAATVTSGAGDRENWLEQVEHRDELMRAVAQLSEDEREAIALRYGADLTLPEIAKLVRQPLSTVEGRVYRSLRKLLVELR